MGYVIAHGCKECLVERPEQWPGASSVKALLEGTVLQGRWIDRTAFGLALKQHREGKPVPQVEDFATPYPVTLTPLPCWESLDSEQQRGAVRTLVDKATNDAADENRRTGRRPLGAKRVCRQSPHKRPDRVKKGPAPAVHATTLEARQAFLAAYRAFEREFRTAVERVKRGERDVEFPPYAFVPRRVSIPTATAAHSTSSC
jgi:hypothetical protein